MRERGGERERERERDVSVTGLADMESQRFSLMMSPASIQSFSDSSRFFTPSSSSSSSYLPFRSYWIQQEAFCLLVFFSATCGEERTALPFDPNRAARMRAFLWAVFLMG